MTTTTTTEAEVKDLAETSARRRRIAVIPGDGIGKEVIPEARRVLEAVCGENLTFTEFDWGADRYLRDGTTLPADAPETLARDFDAILLGAMGDPRVPSNVHAADILLGLRFKLDLYVNARPCILFDRRMTPLKDRTEKDIQFMVFRENTEGLYSGIGGFFKKGTADEVATQEDVNTRKGVERIVRAAFEWAKAHGKKRVHLVDKSNAMRHAHELWYRVFFELAGSYEGIEARHVYVDAMCLYLVEDPSQFEVVVTCNLFGDIVTDLGAALQGGLGMAASANVHPRVARCCEEAHDAARVGMFEPVHGSAPPLAGKDTANPLASVLTVGMMLAHLGWPEEERRLEGLVTRAIAERRCTRDVGGDLGTRSVGDFILSELAHAF